jgi:hypothetical protein
MKNLNPVVSTCRHCQHYISEGRRGGHCQQLNAPVQGCWTSCSLAISPFAPSWEATQGITLWPQQQGGLEEEFVAVCLDTDVTIAVSPETLNFLETLTTSS